MEFTFVGGHLGLDLMATKRYRNRESCEELLSSPEDFARWCVAAGLLTEAPAVTEAELVAVRQLREWAYRLVLASSRGEALDPAGREVLNRAAAGAPVSVSLDRADALTATGTVEQVLATVARQLVEVLAVESDASLRQCDGEHCTRFFIDRSRAQNRRFCSDRLCGNRAKVAAFRQRTKAASEPTSPSAAD